MKTIIGIDPGQKGGIAIFNNIQCDVIAMPISSKEVNVLEIKDWIKSFAFSWKNIIAYVEKVHAMPQQGVSSTFKFGYNYGILHGIIRTMDIPLKLVTPQAWKKVILAGTDKSKDAAIDYCARVFPQVSLLATERSRKPHDGMAEALCIAEYGWKQENS